MICQALTKQMENSAAYTLSMAIFHYHQSKYPEKTDEELDTITTRCINAIGILSIKYKHRWFKNSEITIFLTHPGVLIGHRGELVEHVKKAFERSLPKITLKVEEVRGIPYLYHYRDELAYYKQIMEDIYKQYKEENTY